MKIMVVGDVHFSSKSALMPQRGQLFNERLENCVQSLNWAENSAEMFDVDEIIYAGDFFDRSTLNADEITALTKVEWAPLPHRILLGDHDVGGKKPYVTPINIFANIPEFIPLSGVAGEKIDKEDVGIIYLPYSGKPDVQLKRAYELGAYTQAQRHIVISHNPIKGLYGGESGLTFEQIKEISDLFLTGHYHYAKDLFDDPNIISIGTLTQQDTSEAGSLHRILVIDTADMTVQSFQNPMAITFYQRRVPKHKYGVILPSKIGQEGNLEIGDYVEATDPKLIVGLEDLLNDLLNDEYDGPLLKLQFYYNEDDCVVFYTHRHKFYPDGLKFYINNIDMTQPTEAETKSYIAQYIKERRHILLGEDDYEAFDDELKVVKVPKKTIWRIIERKPLKGDKVSLHFANEKEEVAHRYRVRRTKNNCYILEYLDDDVREVWSRW